ncbi:hypothetical protein KW787_03960 [Candidatus Pacearchaeota archaeon]|nr:hypothetical protein [Candidatus Pacearchaeota archaeon]
MKAAFMVAGTILVLLGLLAYFYGVTQNQSYFFGAYQQSGIQRPYRSYSIPLVVIGAVFLVIGAAMPDEVRVTERVVHERPVLRSRTVKRTVVAE